MADITKCTNNECPKAKECYRIKAKSSEWQSWSDFSKVCNEDNGYEYKLEV